MPKSDRVVRNDNGLLVEGDNTAVGYLIFDPSGRAFDPNGFVPGVTKDEGEDHNQLLDEMLLTGLDENCEIGQGNYFYVDMKSRRITTWHGTELGKGSVDERNRYLTFARKGKTFRGELTRDVKKGESPCWFERIT